MKFEWIVKTGFETYCDGVADRGERDDRVAALDVRLELGERRVVVHVRLVEAEVGVARCRSIFET